MFVSSAPREMNYGVNVQSRPNLPAKLRRNVADSFTKGRASSIFEYAAFRPVSPYVCEAKEMKTIFFIITISPRVSVSVCQSIGSFSSFWQCKSILVVFISGWETTVVYSNFLMRYTLIFLSTFSRLIIACPVSYHLKACTLAWHRLAWNPMGAVLRA